jgi:hypothetical protein
MERGKIRAGLRISPLDGRRVLAFLGMNAEAAGNCPDRGQIELLRTLYAIL